MSHLSILIEIGLSLIKFKNSFLWMKKIASFMFLTAEAMQYNGLNAAYQVCVVC